jgi:predicted nucleic acid-binding protein
VNILVDTDVLIDLALGRGPHDTPAARLMDVLDRRRAAGFLAWHSASNVHHLVAPRLGKAGARAFLLDLAQFIEIAPTTTESLRQAGRLNLRDFEDAMQVAAALVCGADLIATRNYKDYAGAPVRAITPAAILQGLGS